jgi:UDP-N-acetylmuramate dehydrogenase
MNAGCYGGETWSVVDRVVTVDRGGVQRIRAREEFSISYRHCELPHGEEWFAAAWFRLAKGDGAVARERIKNFLARRVATQPLQLPNAGSVFRNPAGDHAARLIEFCGLKGLERNGARVSEKHANFIVNPKGAGRASDIEWLIDSVRTTVRDRTGVDLQPEVRIVGETR